MIEFEDRSRYDSFWGNQKSETLKLFWTLIGQYELSDMARLELWDSQLNIYNNRLPGSAGYDFDLAFTFNVNGGNNMIEFRFYGYCDVDIPEDWGLRVSVILKIPSIQRNVRIKKYEKHLDLHDVMNKYDTLCRLVDSGVISKFLYV